MKNLLILFIVILATGCGSSGNTDREPAPGLTRGQTDIGQTDKGEYVETITKSELRDIVYELASEKMQGRFSTTDGAKRAARFIATQLEESELEFFSAATDDYYQEFQMDKKQLKECVLENEYGRADKWMDFAERFSHFTGEKEVELVFAGFGLQKDIEQINVDGKLIAFFIGDQNRSDFVGHFEEQKIQFMLDKGAIGPVMIYRDDKMTSMFSVYYNAFYSEPRHYLHKTEKEAMESERSIAIKADALAELFNIRPEELNNDLKLLNQGETLAGKYHTSVTMRTKYASATVLTGQNVLGCIHSLDENKPWIVLSAHYDHLGQHQGKTYNGADDNASGVAALLEISEALSEAARNGITPDYNLLFLFTDAEEIGVNGSLNFIESLPFDIDQILVDINIDAVGRNDAANPALKDYLYCHTSEWLPEWLEKRVEQSDDMIPEIKLKTPSRPPGSDNYMFEMKDVPAIAFTTGRNSDYHQPGDTSDKINYKNLTLITQKIFTLLWNISYPKNHP